MDELIDISLIVVIAIVDTVDNIEKPYVIRIWTRIVLWINHWILAHL
jgi:hypothetical protein